MCDGVRECAVSEIESEYVTRRTVYFVCVRLGREGETSTVSVGAVGELLPDSVADRVRDGEKE